MLELKKGDILLNTYRVESEAIHGCMADVYKVRHLAWGKDMAMKVYSVDFTSEFKEKCYDDMYIGLYPNIITNYCRRFIEVHDDDQGEMDSRQNGSERAAVFSEWADCGTVADLIAGGGLTVGCSPEERLKKILTIAIESMRGLQCIHVCDLNNICAAIQNREDLDERFAHGHIRPSNILLFSDGSVKISGFELNSGKNDHSKCEGILNSRSYTAPEQQEGKRPSVVSDIYSWALTITLLFIEIPDDETWYFICQNAFRNAKTLLEKEENRVPRKVKKLLVKCLNRNDYARPDSSQIISDLINIFEEETGCKYDVKFDPMALLSVQDFNANVNNRALMLFESGNTEKAISELTASVERSPRNYDGIYNLGIMKNTPLSEIAFWLDNLGAGDTNLYYDVEYAMGKSSYLRGFQMDETVVNAVVQNGKLYVKYKSGNVFELDVKSGEKTFVDPSSVRFSSRLNYLNGPGRYVYEQTLEGGRTIVVTVQQEAEDNGDQIKPFAQLEDIVNGKRRILQKWSNGTIEPPVVFMPGVKNYVTLGKGRQTLFLREIPTYYPLKLRYGKSDSVYRQMCGVIDVMNALNSVKADDEENLPETAKRLNALAGDPMICCVWREYYLKKCELLSRYPDNYYPREFSLQSNALILENVSPENVKFCFGEEEDCFAVYEYGTGISVFKGDGTKCGYSPEDYGELTAILEDAYISEVEYELNDVNFFDLRMIAIRLGFLYFNITAEYKYYSYNMNEDVSDTAELNLMLDINTGEILADPYKSYSEREDDKNADFYLNWLRNRIYDRDYINVDFDIFTANLGTYVKHKGLYYILAFENGNLYYCQINFNLGYEKKDIGYPEDADKVPNLENQSGDTNEDAGFGEQPKSGADKSVSGESESDHNLSQLAENVEKLEQMSDDLSKEVIGQEHAIQEFIRGLFMAQLSELGTDRSRPKAVFTFAGPPGVGKTMLAEKAAKVLGLPIKRFDMSEYGGDSQPTLIGVDSGYKDAKEGMLTRYVRDNPNAILLFDEIEKAHTKIVNLFLQILDQGVLNDIFLMTGGKAQSADEFNRNKAMAAVSFKDTIIIFTSNAGHSIYESDDFVSGADVSTSVLMNAIKNEGVLPSAIVSRISAGYPILFNNLVPNSLLKICESNFNAVKECISSQYGIDVEANKQLFATLLYSLGGRTDARMLSVKARGLLYDEMYKILRSDPYAFKGVNKLVFSIDTDDASGEVKELYDTKDKKLNVLLYANEEFCKNTALDKLNVRAAHNIEEALALAKGDIDAALLELAPSDEPEEAALDERTQNDLLPPKRRGDTYKLFKMLRAEQAELPLYILVNAENNIKSTVVSNYIKEGARGSIKYGGANTDAAFDEMIENVKMQSNVKVISNGHRRLEYETAPIDLAEPSAKGIRLKNLRLVKAPLADDMAMLISDAEKPTERFEDVVGAGAAKEALSVCVEFLRDPRKFLESGNQPPKGVLLYGPPGTGKTMLAKTLAGECNVTFLPTSGSALLPHKYTGTGDEAVRELFKTARRYAPSIIFIDEVDAVASKRGPDDKQSNNESINALLTEMQGFKANPKRPVLVVAATNLKDALDEAFVRRFDCQVCVDLPNFEERVTFIKKFIERLNSHISNADNEEKADVSERDIEEIAKRMRRQSPGHMKNILQNAVNAARQNNKALDAKVIISAFEDYLYGKKQEHDTKSLEQTAYHESGHALINYLCGHLPAYLTIESRGSFGGYMERSEKEMNKEHVTRDDVLGYIRCALGGRAAEVVRYGPNGITSGASSDLEQATNMAYNMVARYGMDEEFGLMSTDPKSLSISESMRERITDRVNEILHQEFEKAKQAVTEHGDKLAALAEKLIKEESLTEDQIKEILDPHK